MRAKLPTAGNEVPLSWTLHRDLCVGRWVGWVVETMGLGLDEDGSVGLWRWVMEMMGKVMEMGYGDDG